jgi:FkbM family methyltransferase
MRGNSFFRANFEFIANVLKGKIVTVAQNKMKPLTFSVRGRRMKMRFPSFIAQYRNIFLSEEYAFSFDGSSPRILDIGANFGMSILYFKILYPNSRIMAFEADPEIFALLKENHDVNNISGVDLHNEAAWICEDEMQFIPDALGGGCLSVNSSSKQNKILVKAIDLKKILKTRPFDIIKMDVEGAEIELIPHIIDKLQLTSLLVFEYHAAKNKPQKLGAILSLFESRGYWYYLKTEDKLQKPFLNELPGNFDNRVVVYCKKSCLESKFEH